MATPVEQVLDLARWAPSGDNTQPWRFQIVGPDRFVVHGRDTRDECVYDLDGHASQTALGALLETAAIAASVQGMALEVSRRGDLPETTPTFDCALRPDPGQLPSDLIAAIRARSVHRRPYSRRPLTGTEKSALQQMLDPGYRIRWFEGGDRLGMALLMFRNAHLRLTLREAFEVHRRIIDWGQRFSDDRVPDQALGLDPMTIRLMRWVLGRWERVVFFNRYLAGTWAPRIQMDLMPGLMCGAHFVLLADHPPASVDDFVSAGRMVQRLWLTSTRLGLQQQPEITPLIFSRYVREGRSFSTDPTAKDRAAALERRFAQLLGEGHDRAVWVGRIGAAPEPWSRSLRRSLQALTQGA